MGREPMAVEVDVVRISSDEEGDIRLLPGAAAGDDPIALELLDRADLIQQGLRVEPQLRAPDGQPVSDIGEVHVVAFSTVAVEWPQWDEVPRPLGGIPPGSAGSAVSRSIKPVRRSPGHNVFQGATSPCRMT